MHSLRVPHFDDLLLASGRSPEELERELRLLLAVKLFEVKRVSIGQVWRDPDDPNPFAASFPEDSVSFKLLFTTAAKDQVPYLAGSPEWVAQAVPQSGAIFPIAMFRLRLISSSALAADVCDCAQVTELVRAAVDRLGASTSWSTMQAQDSSRPRRTSRRPIGGAYSKSI